MNWFLLLVILLPILAGFGGLVFIIYALRDIDPDGH